MGRPGEMFAAVAVRAEGGADASEGGEGAQRRNGDGWCCRGRMFFEGGVSDRRQSDRW